MSPNLDTLATFLLCFARVTAFFVAAPLSGESGFSGRLRVMFSAVIAAALVPVRPTIVMDQFFFAMPGELLLGLAFGFSARVVLAGVEAGGQLLGLKLELGFAGTFDPMAREEALPTRRIAHALAGLAFVAQHGFELALRGLVRTAVPTRALGVMTERMVDATADVFLIGIRMSAPLLIAAVTINFALALGARAAPALNIFSVMLAATLVVGASVLLGAAPGIVHEMWNAAARATVAGMALARP